MARLSYVDPETLTDPQIRQWLDDAVAAGRPGPENQAIRAHNKVVMRSFTSLIRTMKDEGIVEPELRELLRARIATSWGSMFQTDCHY
mgnify:CR=1 FL=1